MRCSPGEGVGCWQLEDEFARELRIEWFAGTDTRRAKEGSDGGTDGGTGAGLRSTDRSEVDAVEDVEHFRTKLE